MVCLDASEAVFANRSNCSRLGDYQICRADINASPLRPRSFDVVICLGVIQHTPSPEQTIADLARHVKSGGLLVIDHYARRSSLNALSDRLTLAYPLRAILRRVARRRPDLSLRATKRITAICDPVRKRTQNSPFLHRLTGRVFPTPCYYRAFPRLPSDLVYRWNELDTHDLLSTWFRHRRSREEIIRAMQSAGLASIEAWYGGNGVEAVGRYA